MNKSCFINLLLLTLLTLFISCGDIFNAALLKDLKNVPPVEVSNLISVAGDGNVQLSWTNPSSSYFDKVVLLRKTENYPYSYNDTSATIVYDGSSTSYTDSSVTIGETYYYSIYAVNSEGIYSTKAARTLKTVASFNRIIRERSFYLVGGSSSYSDPFNNLVTEIDAFDPVTDTVYQNIATLPRGRYSCAVASAGGKIYIFGGLDKDQATISAVDVLNISSPTWPAGVWTTAKDMPFPRYSLRAETLYGKIYAFGGSTNISVPWAAATDNNHRFDPVSNTWSTDESKVPRLTYRFMNFGSGAYGGTIVYGVGRYNGTAAFNRTTRIHNIFANFSDAPDDYSTLTNLASPAAVLYQKLLSNNTELLIYFTCGGCSNTNTYYEPLRTTAGGELTPVSTCHYMKLLSAASDLDYADVGQTLTTARAYAEAEYYGDYVYVFCGLTSTILNSYEKLDVNDGAFGVGWAETTSTGLNSRYAFDITKVNF